MAEEKNNEKPKATLIKHPKPAPSAIVKEEGKGERKKVVIVRKKIKKLRRETRRLADV